MSTVRPPDETPARQTMPVAATLSIASSTTSEAPVHSMTISGEIVSNEALPPAW